MNVKKERPASLTSSLLARKGEAEPARLADGSAPRDVMALHEEIVARLAEEIEQEGLFRHGDDDARGPDARAAEEPAFDFGDDDLGSAPAVDDPEEVSLAGAEPVQAHDNPPYDDDTDFGYDAEAEEAGEAEAPPVAALPPVIAAPQLSAVRPGSLRDEIPAAGETPVAAARAASHGARQSAFVTLRPADSAPGPHAKATPTRMIASLPMAFAVMVAIAIGGGLGLWVAGSLAPHPPASQGPVAARDVPPPRAGDGSSAAPLEVPSTGEVAVAPIDAPAAPALRESAPVAAVPVPTPAPAPPAAAAPASVGISGAYGIQLLAAPAQQEAEDAWTRISAKHKAALGKLPHEVVRVDLGAKGVFYRLRAGSFASRADAKAVCAALAAAKQDCIVVKR